MVHLQLQPEQLREGSDWLSEKLHIKESYQEHYKKIATKEISLPSSNDGINSCLFLLTEPTWCIRTFGNLLESFLREFRKTIIKLYHVKWLLED